MKRDTKVRPGHDCIYAPCRFERPCKPPPSGSNHGISDDDWIYSVVSDDGLTALTLLVGSEIFPSSIPAAHFRNYPLKGPHGTFWTLHVAFPVDRENIRDGRWGQECDLLQGGRCADGGVFYLACDEFYKEHGNPVAKKSEEQSEAFWRALEAKHDEWAKDAHEKRADTKWERCNHCDGLGTVAKGESA